LPYSLVENIHISTWQCWMLMGALCFFIMMAQFRSYRYFIMFFFCMAIFSLLQWNYYFERRDKIKIAVYKIPGHSAMDFFAESKVFFLSDSALYQDAGKIRFHVRPNRLISGVHEVYNGPKFNFIYDIGEGKAIIWRNKKLLYLADNATPLPRNFVPDLIVIANNANIDMAAFDGQCRNSIFVFDSSNSFYYVKKKLIEAEQLKLTAYSVLHNGAFELTL
jgi:competence protein ComEC